MVTFQIYRSSSNSSVRLTTTFCELIMCKTLHREFYLNYLIMISKPVPPRPSAYSGEAKVHASTTISSLSFSLCFTLSLPLVCSWAFPKLTDRTHFSPPSCLACLPSLNCCLFFHRPLPAGLIFPCPPVPVSLFTSLSLPSDWPQRPGPFSHVFTLLPLLRSGSHTQAKIRRKRPTFVQLGEQG